MVLFSKSYELSYVIAIVEKFHFDFVKPTLEIIQIMNLEKSRMYFYVDTFTYIEIDKYYTNVKPNQ